MLARKDIGESARLVSYSLNGRESLSPAHPKIDQKKLLFEVGDAAAQWAAVAIRDNSKTSAAVPLQHADVTSATTHRQKMSRRLRNAAGASSLTEIAGVLDQFGILLFDLADLSTVTSRRMTGNKRLRPGGTTDAKPMQLRPEDFVVEWSPRSHQLAHRTSATSGLEDFFDALAALTGGRFTTRPESKQNDDDTDRALADEKIFDEEDFAEQREKGREGSDSSGDLAAREQPPDATHLPPESRDEQLKAARRVAKRLSHFIKRFCQHVESGLGDGPISVRLLG